MKAWPSLLLLLLLLLSIWIPKAEAQTPTPTVYSSTYVSSLNRSSVNWDLHGISALNTLGAESHSKNIFVSQAANGIIINPVQTLDGQYYTENGVKVGGGFYISGSYVLNIPVGLYLTITRGVGFQYTLTMPPPTPTPTSAPTPTPIFQPTPSNLTDGVVMDAMSLVADETIRISATSLGMYILAPVLLLGGMHLLWGFIVRRTRS